MIRETKVRQVKDAGFDLFTPNEVADIGSVSLVTVYRHVDEGKLKAVRVGGVMRIERRAIEAWLSTPYK